MAIDTSGDDSASVDHDLHIDFGVAVSVYPNKGDEITVSIARVDEDTDRVQRDVISVPYEQARQIGEALLRLAEQAKVDGKL
ncbi:hypothetical protein [Achromobacter insolitus]|uniref:hypothetical protein n=1 Tax=Achromobacter insolitus TaxID=217204 RepID=UPI0028B05896|nr:hypothetical protein [Achromobacter insolitus]